MLVTVKVSVELEARAESLAPLEKATLAFLLISSELYNFPGVLNEVQEYYGIDDSMGGLIQTIFIAFFIIGSPICGYLGDR